MRVAAALAVLPVAVALVALPRPALLLWAGLGVMVGALTELWCRAAEDMGPAHGRATALRVGGATVVGGWALAGTTLLIGPASMAVIPAALVALAVNVRGTAGTRPRA